MESTRVYETPVRPDKWHPAAVRPAVVTPKEPPPDEPATLPPIAVTRPAAKPRARLSARAAALFSCCLISFAAGVSLSDDALCRMLTTLSCLTLGDLPTPLFFDVSPSERTEQTVFDRFRVEQPVTPAVPAAGEPLPLVSPPAPDLPDPAAATPVDAVGADRIASDDGVFLPVMARDLSADDVTSLLNQTSYTPDTAALADAFPKALTDLSIAPDAPLVLILHTHGTESYNESGRAGYYAVDAPVRDEDPERNVVSIGSALAEVLSDFGIPTVHDEKMCDAASFLKAYSTSAQEAKTMLEAYPSVRIVIDLHRDAIEDANGVRTAPTFTYADEQTAQLMFVVGTDETGNPHPGWRDNLNLALYLQKQIGARVPGLFRRTNLRAPSFNEQYSPGYLLLECGSCANTREEALRAARLFASELARIILASAA